MALQLTVRHSCWVYYGHQAPGLWEKEMVRLRHQKSSSLHVLEGCFLHLTQLTRQRIQQVITSTAGYQITNSAKSDTSPESIAK